MFDQGSALQSTLTFEEDDKSVLLVNISTSSPPSYPLFDYALASFEQCTNNFTIRHTVTALYTQADHVTV